jgi:hypothetical protein
VLVYHQYKSQLAVYTLKDDLAPPKDNGKHCFVTCILGRFHMAQTSVCNVRVQYIRPLYKNLAEWMKEPDNVYVGRGGAVVIDGVRFPKHSSLWANPFKKGRDGSKADVLKAYDIYIRKKIREEGLNKELELLRNKCLGCWCVEEVCYDCDDLSCMVCHGQVLLKLLKERG